MRTQLSVMVLMTGLALGGTAQAHGLLDAYRAALQRDPQFAAAQAARDAAVEAQPQAWAALLPQLEATAAVGRERYRFEDAAPISSDPTQPQPDAADARLSATRRRYGLDLRQTLWSVEAFQRLRAANAEAARAEAEYREAQQALMLRVAESYFGALAAADTLDAGRGERAAYGALVEQAQKRLQTGLGARIGVEEAQAFHSLTEQSVIDAELALLDAQRGLQQLTGSLPALTPLRAEIPLVAPQPASAEDWLVAARDGNYAVQAAALRSEAAERSVAAARGRYLPTVSLQGSLGKTELVPELGGDQRLDSIGVVASWPLFQGGQLRSQRREASALLRQAQAEAEGRKRQAERDTLAAFRGVVAGIRGIQAAQRAVAANRTAVEASQNGVEAGTRTEFDLLNAQNNYYAALRAYYRSRYDYLNNTLRLKAQAGRLTLAELQAVDALLGEDGAALSQPAEPAP